MKKLSLCPNDSSPPDRQTEELLSLTASSQTLHPFPLLARGSHYLHSRSVKNSPIPHLEIIGDKKGFQLSLVPVGGSLARKAARAVGAECTTKPGAPTQGRCKHRSASSALREGYSNQWRKAASAGCPHLPHKQVRCSFQISARCRNLSTYGIKVCVKYHWRERNSHGPFIYLYLHTHTH